MADINIDSRSYFITLIDIVAIKNNKICYDDLQNGDPATLFMVERVSPRLVCYTILYLDGVILHVQDKKIVHNISLSVDESKLIPHLELLTNKFLAGSSDNLEEI